MIPAIRSEFRKLLTVRSTYIVSIVLLLFLGFISFWVAGYKNSPQGLDSHYLYNTINIVAPLTSIFGAIVAVLLMAHEYRYNTIVYTLTAAKSRSKVLTAKIITVVVYVTLLTVIVTAVSLALATWGNSLAGHPLPHQDINLLALLAKAIFYCVGYALFGLLVVTLIRNLTFTIVFLLIAPSTIETLLNLLLKKNAVYLPFSALNQVISTSQPAQDTGPFTMGYLSPLKGAMVFMVYLVVGWAITWYLFLRRDAL